MYIWTVSGVLCGEKCVWTEWQRDWVRFICYIVTGTWQSDWVRFIC